MARAIYLGSAPTASAAHRGIEDRRVKLGCVMLGETPTVFGDALRRLAGAATFLYQEGPRYWYSTQPTVSKLAEDRAEQLKRDPDKVVHEIDSRLRANLRQMGDFNKVHPLPQSSQDVPDELEARLVVLRSDAPYSKEQGNPAENAARTILETRGNAPRLYRNTLVFLAADKTRLQDLDEAARRYIAWQSILAEKVTLDLTPHQVKQAETQLASADSTVATRLPEAYQWLLVPEQGSPQAAIEWQAIRLSGQDALAARASRKLRSEELLVAGFAATRLRMELDRVPLWRSNRDVAVSQLVEDFARYPYLPRLKDPSVLLAAVREGVSLLTWEKDSFAYADSFDEAAGRYRGLRGGQQVSIVDADSAGLVVKPENARAQIQQEAAVAPIDVAAARAGGAPPGSTAAGGGSVVPRGAESAAKVGPKRFHGSANLDSERVGRDAGRIAEEVISHLAGLVGSELRVTLEIEAELPAGAPENVVRTVTENCRALKFTTHAFEKE